MPKHSLATARTIAGFTVLAVLAAACSSDQVSTTDQTTTTVEATTPTTVPADTTTVAPTSLAETTTIPSTTTEAATTTEPETSTTLAATTTTTTTTEPGLTAADLTLASAGVLPFMFGDTDGNVIAGLTTALGAPATDDVRTYPTADGDSFVNTDTEESFTHPIGRNVCFTNELCAQFGGATVDTLIFTGWDIAGEGAPQVFTAEGITVGSVMSDFVGVVDIDGGGCYSVGWGDAAGVELTMLSTGEPFGSFDTEGNYVIGNPAPADVTVLALSAGDVPFYLYEDC